MGYTTGIVLFDEAEELDFVGPLEVFGMAAMSEREDRVVTIAESGEPVRCANGMRVLPDHSFADAPPLDVVLVPGGMGTRQQAKNPVLLDWLRKVSPSCKWITSVCTGSYVLSEAGLVNGKRITTHWAFIEELRGSTKATVLERIRYVRDANVVTAAGVSAGIDMALWVVGQLHGPDFARRVQHLMEYDPAPPYSAEV